MHDACRVETKEGEGPTSLGGRWTRLSDQSVKEKFGCVARVNFLFSFHLLDLRKGAAKTTEEMFRASLAWRGNSTSNLRTRTWILPDLRKKDATALPFHKTGQLNTREAFSKNPGAAEYEQYTGTTGSTWKHTTRSNSFPGSGDRGKPFVDKRNHYENREKFSQYVKGIGGKGRNPYSD